MTTFQLIDEELLYPSSDDEPMAESTKQYEWIVRLKENCERLFSSEPNVFIAADLFWYPVSVDSPPAPHQAPDVMVIFGRPKGPRKSYRQWKERDIAPQVIFEILSASNKTRKGLEKMDEKFLFYQKYGVEEYYIYDPDEYTLEGYLRQGNQLISIAALALQNWRSPRLGITLRSQPGDLEVFYPDGRPFLSFLELAQLAEFQEARADRAQDWADQQTQRADEAERRAKEAEQQVKEQQRTIAQNLRATGMETGAIAAVIGLDIAGVEQLLEPIA
jgi:Uma2 family endonuclease